MFRVGGKVMCHAWRDVDQHMQFSSQRVDREENKFESEEFWQQRHWVFLSEWP